MQSIAHIGGHMFVVARREGEEIMIAEVIRVKVLSVTGKIVRLGFEAPKGVRIERIEVDVDASKLNSLMTLDNGAQ